MTVFDVQFDDAFRALTDHSPLGWQRRLFEQLRSRQEIPRICDLPTGLGKTSVIPIWTIALAWQAQDGSVNLPRRLVYVVNRRTVVDQATGVVEQIRERLLAPADPCWPAHQEALRSLSRALQKLTSTEDLLLAVSTLRGEHADNEEWTGDPSRPAIIIGTIDMIGSKLLFSGYGDGRYQRAQHAGLVGQDSLIVHDEAHLTPAFSDLLRRLADVQRQSGEPRPVRVMELSATSRGGNGPILKLEPKDEEDKVVRERLDATKRLHLHQVPADSGEKQADVATRALTKLVALSMEHRNKIAKVLIYVRSPENGLRVLNLLNNQLENEAKGRVALLTGTMRGHEREQLIRTSLVYRAFLDPEAHVDQTIYLVSTSAGEVGIDMDADHMVCDLTTLDSMIQRLGRVNRRGGQGREARVDVVMQTGGPDTKDNPSDVEEAMKATLKILVDWAIEFKGAIDVSPRSLRVLLDGLDPERREKAFAPKPAVPPLTEILLDAWSLTSITEHMPGRPEVASYLHGLEKDLPETYVVWRKEVALLGKHNVDQDTLEDWFQACRIEARERLRDRTDRVKGTLGDLLKVHQKKHPMSDFPVVVLSGRGEAKLLLLSHISEKEFNLSHRTVVLPVEAGGLNRDGALDAKADEAVTDVAEDVTKGQRRERWLLTREADSEWYEHLVTGKRAESLPKDLSERERVILQHPQEGAEQDGESRDLLLMQPKQSRPENPERAKAEQTLNFHGQQTAEHMAQIAERLGLDATLKEALTLAARWHDLGKARPVWQRYACNHNPDEPVAKSMKYLHSKALGGYRHEFGSLLEASANDQVWRHAEADLILHLITAHHGWGRPHFPERKAWDNTYTTAENEEAAVEAMRRFGRLQQRFGRWGLAWLEALVRCADIAASKQDTPPLPAASHGEVNP